MSTIKTDTLQNVAGTKSVPVDTVVDGSAKAWVKFNGTGTVAILAAFNVSSITDNGVGDYVANFTSALADVNVASIAISSGGQTSASANATGIFVGTRSSAGAAADASIVSAAAFR